MKIEESFRYKIIKVLNNMSSFKPKNDLQIALLSLLAHRLAVRDEHEDLAQTFMHLDKDSDGVLSRKEFLL